MTATLAHLVFDQAGTLAMVVVPDDDKQLSDPAFNPKGMIAVSVPLSDYQSCQTADDVLTLAQPMVAQISPVAADGITETLQPILADPVLLQAVNLGVATLLPER